jgi:5-methylcytosine-specific restriction endonuclease McrA
MSNRWGIPKKIEEEIRARDKRCVFCHVSMRRASRARGTSDATIEHFNNDGPLGKKYNVAICCRGCNSSKGTKRLLAWFKTPYCRKRKINEKTVAKPVKEYLRRSR